MRYHTAKADANQPEIVDAFRKLGAYVLHIHRLKNCCDLVVLYKGQVVMVEVKMPSKKLTKGEDEFAQAWTRNGGKWACIRSAAQARELIIQMRNANEQRTPAKAKPPVETGLPDESEGAEGAARASSAGS